MGCCIYDLQYELYYDKHCIYFMNDCWHNVIKSVYDTHPMPLLITETTLVVVYVF